MLALCKERPRRRESHLSAGAYLWTGRGREMRLFNNREQALAQLRAKATEDHGSGKQVRGCDLRVTRETASTLHVQGDAAGESNKRPPSKPRWGVFRGVFPIASRHNNKGN